MSPPEPGEPPVASPGEGAGGLARRPARAGALQKTLAPGAAPTPSPGVQAR